MHQAWVEQVLDVLDSVEGKKIIFAMSGPSIAAIIAGAQRDDVTHLICDSGPFKEIWQCTYRLLTQIWHIPTAPLRALFTTVAVFLWGPTAFRRSQKALRSWNKKIPILSIRGTLDPLVFPENIDGIFKDHSDLNIKVWTIANAHHLDGLKLFPHDYEREIASFLLAR
jgi:pimeloyl-ACP methyl ester carboxylesterase